MDSAVDAAGRKLSEQGLRNYLDVAEAASDIGRRSHDILIERCVSVDSLIGRATCSVQETVTIPASLLNLNSRLFYCASVQTALTGHVSAIYPALRACLESACYAESIVYEPTLGDVWIERHKDGDARKKCRKSFGANLVRNAGRRLQTILEGADSLIIDTYERHIDLGAHPNPAGVVLGMQIGETPDNWIVNLAGPTSQMIEPCLLECFETGLFASLVIANEAGMASHLREDILALMEVRNEWHAELMAKGSAQCLE